MEERQQEDKKKTTKKGEEKLRKKKKGQTKRTRPISYSNNSNRHQGQQLQV